MRLGELERDVMERLWAVDGPVTVRAVHGALAAERDLAYTTVMTVLDRLAKKGAVRRVREGKAYWYEPAATRDEMVAGLMHEALAGAGDDRSAALVHFVGQASQEEATALRDALAAVDKRHAARRKDRLG
ncbi:MAG: BlaI/MecI/CopY family transcriptional regulator [Streptosporangiales bacterium]